MVLVDGSQGRVTFAAERGVVLALAEARRMRPVSAVTRGFDDHPQQLRATGMIAVAW